MTTLLHYMHFHHIRMLDRFERRSHMSGLASAFLAMPFPQTLRRRFVQAIAGRRFAAVATVLYKLIFKSLDVTCQLLQGSME